MCVHAYECVCWCVCGRACVAACACMHVWHHMACVSGCVSSECVVEQVWKCGFRLATSLLAWIRTRLLRRLGDWEVATHLDGRMWPGLALCGTLDRMLYFCQFPSLSLMLSPKAKPCPEPNPIVAQFGVHMFHLVASCW